MNDREKLEPTLTRVLFLTGLKNLTRIKFNLERFHFSVGLTPGQRILSQWIGQVGKQVPGLPPTYPFRQSACQPRSGDSSNWGLPRRANHGPVLRKPWTISRVLTTPVSVFDPVIIWPNTLVSERARKMKISSLVWFLSLCSIQLVSPRTPKINLCCRKDHAYKVKDKMREKPRCDLSFTVRFLAREVSGESTNDYIPV